VARSASLAATRAREREARRKALGVQAQGGWGAVLRRLERVAEGRGPQGPMREEHVDSAFFLASRLGEAEPWELSSTEVRWGRRFLSPSHRCMQVALLYCLCSCRR